MAKCIRCGKKGLFLKINNFGLCSDCQNLADLKREVENRYYSGMEKLQADWSLLYNLKQYTGAKADLYISQCKQNIELYKKMCVIEKKYGDTSPPNVPAYTRLAMIYERRGEFDKSVAVCREALKNGVWGDGMQARFIRMIKKSGRAPTSEEIAFAEKFLNE